MIVVVFLIAALLAAFSLGDTMPTGVTLQMAYLMCDNSEEAVLGCAAHFLDLNHDGNITRSECTAGLAQMTLPSVNITTDYIFNGAYVRECCYLTTLTLTTSHRLRHGSG